MSSTFDERTILKELTPLQQSLRDAFPEMHHSFHAFFDYAERAKDQKSLDIKETMEISARKNFDNAMSQVSEAMRATQLTLQDTIALSTYFSSIAKLNVSNSKVASNRLFVTVSDKLAEYKQSLSPN